jgi:hypothetical protein
MNTALLFLIVAALVVVGLSAFLKAQPAKRPSLPYKRRDYLLTAAERSFYEVLRDIAGDQLHVFPKVRLLDLLYPPKGTENRQGHMNRVMAKHVDFVLCDLQNIKPLLVIELDDSSHEREDRQERDAFVDQALEAASLPILHVTAKHTYAPKELADLIEAKLR